MQLTYNGPHDGVDVDALGDGRVRTVLRDEAESFSVPVAKSLLEQGEAHWTPADESAKKLKKKLDQEAADAAKAAEQSAPAEPVQGDDEVPEPASHDASKGAKE